MAESRDPVLEEANDRFLIGPGTKCTWGHRMKNTRDHAEIVELNKVIGLEAKETNGVSKPETNGTKPIVAPEQNVVESVETPSAEPVTA